MKSDLAKRHAYYNNKFFAKWARLYDFEKYFLFPIRQKAAHFLPLTPLQKIIDVATGTGAQAYELAKLGHDVTGVDLSPEMLIQAKKKVNPDLKLQFLHADGTRLPFKNDTFDIATISLGLHDMPYEIGIKVLQEMRRVTKPNGLILIVDYMEPKKHWVAKISHPLISLYETVNYKPFIQKGLEHYLDKVRLKLLRQTSFFGIMQIVLALNIK